MTNCRSCGTTIKAFMSLGEQPLANALLQPEQCTAKEEFYHLAAAVCSNCYLFQLIDQPPAETMFTERYPFLTSSSRSMSSHFEELAAKFITKISETKNTPFVVEIGANDGTLLKPFAEAKIRHLGIEPSSKSVIGSQGVPYIHEDRISKEDFINACKKIYNMTKEEL